VEVVEEVEEVEEAVTTITVVNQWTIPSPHHPECPMGHPNEEAVNREAPGKINHPMSTSVAKLLICNPIFHAPINNPSMKIRVHSTWIVVSPNVPALI